MPSHPITLRRRLLFIACMAINLSLPSVPVTGGVRVAARDVDVDGLADVITGAGPGGGPHVRVFSGATGADFVNFFAYTPAFTGGVFVSGR